MRTSARRSPVAEGGRIVGAEVRRGGEGPAETVPADVVVCATPPAALLRPDRVLRVRTARSDAPPTTADRRTS